MQAAVINILINLQSKQLGNYGDIKICFPLPLHSTGTDRAFKFLNTSFMFSRALKSLWTVSLLGDAPSSPIPTGCLAILLIQWLGFLVSSAVQARLRLPHIFFVTAIFLRNTFSFCLFVRVVYVYSKFTRRFWKSIFFTDRVDKHFQRAYWWDQRLQSVWKAKGEN